jgi:O-antigen/teichoic acid export membrane protein
VTALYEKIVLPVRARLLQAWGGGSEFRRRVSILAGGTAVAQALNFAVAPVLTRIYGPSAFGNLQVYGALIGFVMIFIALRYDMAVVMPQDDETAANVVAVALTVVLAMTGLISLGVWFVVGHRWLLPGAQGLIPYLWLLPIGACGVGVYQVLVYWGLRHHAYKAIAISKLNQVIAQAAVQVGAGLLTHGGLLALLVGDVCGRVGGSWRIARITLRKDIFFLRRIRPASMWQVAKRYRNYPLILTGAGLINSAGLQIVPLLITAHYGLRMVGLYALVDRSMQAPMILVAQATSQVYAVQAAQLGTMDSSGLKRLFLKITRSSLLYGIVPLALVCAFAPSLFATVFGEQWRAAGQYARILAPAYYFCFAHQCVCMTLAMLERQSWQAAWDIMRLITVVSVLIGCSAAGVSFERTLLALAAVNCLNYVANLLLCYLAITHQRMKPDGVHLHTQDVILD